MPTAQCSSKARAASASSWIDSSTLCTITGLKTLSSKLPCEPPKATAASLPKTCTQTIVMASDCVGLTLPGMIDEPGSFSGIVISPMPLRGPGGQPAHVVGDLHQRAGERAQRGAGGHQGVVGGEGRELVRRRHERAARLLRHLARREVAELRVRVEAGADRGAADRQLVEARDRLAHDAEAVVELGHPAADLLAERDRRRVLQVRAADLDDVGVRLGLGRQRVAQLPDRRQQHVLELLDHRDVHRGREGVVGRLPAVDVVVRVDRLLRAQLAAGQLDGAVRDDLVRVHVRLRAGAGLEDDQREVVVEVAADHLVGGAHDQLDLSRAAAGRARRSPARRPSSGRRGRGSPGG